VGRLENSLCQPWQCQGREGGGAQADLGGLMDGCRERGRAWAAGWEEGGLQRDGGGRDCRVGSRGMGLGW
jgi:hypothetical protein